MMPMTAPNALQTAMENEGFAIVDGVLPDDLVDGLLTTLEHRSNSSVLQRGGKIFAARNLLDVPEIIDLACSTPVRNLLRDVLGEFCFAVRGILFDKIPAANWKVPWHQDVTIAVRERANVEGFGPWTVKAGTLHVQPPSSVLEKMVSVRLHLDQCDESNGALRVIPGSHRYGRIPEKEILSIVQNSREHVCAVNRGGALLMRPLLLHASSPSSSPAHRRVIHIDFASEPLPNPLQWLSNGESMGRRTPLATMVPEIAE